MVVRAKSCIPNQDPEFTFQAVLPPRLGHFRIRGRAKLCGRHHAMPSVLAWLVTRHDSNNCHVASSPPSGQK
jgi:hypothetical protein